MPNLLNQTDKLHPVEITVTPLSLGWIPFVGPASVIEHAAPGLTWDERPKVVVHVTPETTIEELIIRAGQEMGLEDEARFDPGERGVLEHHLLIIALYDEESEDQVADFDAVLDAEGAIEWIAWPYEYTIQDIIDARDQDVIRGDPQRVYLVIDERPAGGLGFDPTILLKALEVISYLLLARDVVHLAAETPTKIQRFRAFVRRKSKLRGSLKRYRSIFAVPRTTKQIARLFDIDEDDVPTVCHFLGIEFIDRAWRPRDTPSTRELNELVDVIDELSETDMNSERIKRVLAEVLGKPPGQRRAHVGPAMRKIAFEDAEGL